MKRIFQIMFTVVAGAAFLACGSDEGAAPDNSGKLTISTADLVYSAEDTAPKSVTVTSDAAWTPKTTDEWVKYSKENNKLVVSVDPNTTRDLRMGVITISSPGAEDKYLNITQTNARFHLTATPTVLAYEYNGGSTAQTVTVSTNSVEGWEIGSYPSWITVSEGTDSFSVTLGDNDETASRFHDLSITVPELRTGVTVRITQTGKPAEAGSKIELSEWRLGVKYAGKTFTITAPDGGLSTATISANKTWVTHTVVNDNTMTVTVAANLIGANANYNGRKAVLSVASGGEVSTINIVQNGYGTSTNGSWLVGTYTAYGTPTYWIYAEPLFSSGPSFATVASRGTNSQTGRELLYFKPYGGENLMLMFTIIDEVPCIIGEDVYELIQAGVGSFPLVYYVDDEGYINPVNLGKPYPVCWNPFTMAVDCSGQYEGYELSVALCALDMDDYYFYGVWTEAYEDLKFFNTIAPDAQRMASGAPAMEMPQEQLTRLNAPLNFPEKIRFKNTDQTGKEIIK